MYTDNVYLN